MHACKRANVFQPVVEAMEGTVRAVERNIWIGTLASDLSVMVSERADLLVACERTVSAVHVVHSSLSPDAAPTGLHQETRYNRRGVQ